MPGIIIHTEIARKVAQALGRNDLLDEDSEISRLYFLGAMAPDMGVFPGCNPILSNLPHYVWTGALAAELLQSASNEFENAFALGWLTHYLGDVRIHPIINRAAAEIELPGKNLSIPWEQNPVLHVQVEQGLDGEMYYDLPVSPFAVTRPPRARLDPGFLPDAFQRIYQVRIAPGDFSFSLKRAQYYHRLMRDLAIIHASFRRRRIPERNTCHHLLLTWLPLVILERLMGRRAPYYQIAVAIAPSEKLKDQIRKAIPEVVTEIVVAYRDPERSLPDFNLDTGDLFIEGGYRTADLTRKWLSEMTPGLQ